MLGATAAVAALSVFAASGLSAASALASPTCVLRSLPRFVERYSPSGYGSVADIVEVGCEPTFAGDMIEVSSDELYAHCNDQLSWYSPYPYAETNGPSVTVKLDDDGNATVALRGGECSYGSVEIQSNMTWNPPFYTVEAPFVVEAPQPTPEGLSVMPSSQIEIIPHASVATIVETSLETSLGQPGEKKVTLESAELFNRCQGAPDLVWIGPNGKVTSGTRELAGVEVDADGNAYAIVLGGSECAAGESLIRALPEQAPFTILSGDFTVEAPQPIDPEAPPPTAEITAPASGKTYAVGELVKTKFSCAEGVGGPGLASCTDSNGGSGTKGTLDTAATGIYTYTVTATSENGQTGTAQITYAVGPKGSKVYEYCGSEVGCGDAFVTKGKTWELPAFGESGTIETIKVGKVKDTDFRDNSDGCVYISVKAKTGYNTQAAPGAYECSGQVYETWYAFEL
jgi:hypothetical protein